MYSDKSEKLNLGISLPVEIVYIDVVKLKLNKMILLLLPVFLSFCFTKVLDH